MKKKIKINFTWNYDGVSYPAGSIVEVTQKVIDSLGKLPFEVVSEAVKEVKKNV